MRHFFVICLVAFVATSFSSQGQAAEPFDLDQYRRCMLEIAITHDDWDMEENPSAFDMNFDHPNVEKYDCMEIYHRFVEYGKGGDEIDLAIVDKLRAARSAGLIDDLRESQTTGCGRYCFSPPKEIHMREDDPIPCVRSDGAIYQRPRGSTESCPAGFWEAD